MNQVNSRNDHYKYHPGIIIIIVLKCSMRLQIKKRYKNIEITLFENMFGVACFISRPCNKYLRFRDNVAKGL